MNELIDTDKELEAIINYVTLNWDGFDKVNAKDFFTKAWTDVLTLTSNKFDEHELHNFVVKLKEDFSPNGNKMIDDKINISDLPVRLLIAKTYLSKFVKEDWVYRDKVNQILTDMKIIFPEASKLKPKGWKEMAKDYNDYDGMEELDEKSLKESFKGMHFSTAVSFPFEVAVSLPHVMYDSKCQGRKPLEALIGAVLAHAYSVSENNNSLKMLQEWIEFENKAKISGQYKFDFREPLNKALSVMILSGIYIKEENPEIFEILNIKNKDKKIKNKLR